MEFHLNSSHSFDACMIFKHSVYVCAQGHAMTHEVSHWLSLLRPGFAPRSVPVGFVADKEAQGEAFLSVLQFSLVSIIPLWLSILTYHMRNEQWA
jgi:hypothetical protein